MNIPNRPCSTEEVLALDRHLVHCFADLNALKEDCARTAPGAAEGAPARDCGGNQIPDGTGRRGSAGCGGGIREIRFCLRYRGKVGRDGQFASSGRSSIRFNSCCSASTKSRASIAIAG